MEHRKRYRLVLILGIAALMFDLAACSTSGQVPTETLVPTSTLTPPPTTTITQTPTLLPSSTLTNTPTATPTELLETHTPTISPTPLVSWKDIPIMQGARNGEITANGYSYETDADADEVRQYYERELPKWGWTPVAVGDSATASFMLIYQMGKTMAFITVAADYMGQGHTLVLLNVV